MESALRGDLHNVSDHCAADATTPCLLRSVHRLQLSVAAVEFLEGRDT
jgi:hypothetical protein